MTNAESPTLIHHFLENSAARLPDKVSIVCGHTRATYAQVNTMANRLARHLRSCGLMKGDRVALIWENGFEYIVSYYAILKAGGVVASLSTALKPDGMLTVLHHLMPEAIIASSHQRESLEESGYALSELLCRVFPDTHSEQDVSWKSVVSEDDGTNLDIAIAAEDLAAITYTSGSAGAPKGVMLSHANIVANTSSICSYLELTENDIQMVVLPFFYVMGKSLLNTHFAAGGRVVINNSFALAAAVIKQMADEHVTGFSGVPSTYTYLLHRSPLAQSRDTLSSLRYCTQAGGHMARDTKHALRDALPDHTRIFIMYGATEASARLTYLDPSRFSDKIDSIGKAIPGVTIRVLGPNGKQVPVGKQGELVASGPNIMMGYWRDAKATRRVLNADGYHTGDIGYCDEDGFLFVTGRADNQLKVGGHRVDPQEIEEALLGSGAVIEAAVFGLPDSLMGSRLVAVAVGATADTCEKELLLHCSKQLPMYKLPQRVLFVASLPKLHSGKIDRIACEQVAMQTMGTNVAQPTGGRT